MHKRRKCVCNQNLRKLRRNILQIFSRKTTCATEEKSWLRLKFDHLLRYKPSSALIQAKLTLKTSTKSRDQRNQKFNRIKTIVLLYYKQTLTKSTLSIIGKPNFTKITVSETFPQPQSTLILNTTKGQKYPKEVWKASFRQNMIKLHAMYDKTSLLQSISTMIITLVQHNDDDVVSDLTTT